MYNVMLPNHWAMFSAFYKTNLKRDKMEIENLKALVYDIPMNPYQKQLARKEFETMQKALNIADIVGSSYRDELINKTISMDAFADEFYKMGEFKKGNKTALENMRVHIMEIYKSHYL